MALLKQQQGGAAEACWTYNPEFGRSKLPPLQIFLQNKFQTTNTQNDKTLFPEHFLFFRIVFLQPIRFYFEL